MCHFVVVAHPGVPAASAITCYACRDNNVFTACSDARFNGGALQAASLTWTCLGQCQVRLRILKNENSYINVI